MRFKCRFFLYIQFVILIFACTTKEQEVVSENPEIEPIAVQTKLGNDKSLSVAERKRHLEKANDLINALPNDTTKIAEIHGLSVDYFFLKDYVQYRVLNEKALELSKLLKDSSAIAKSYSNIGIFYRPNNPEIAYKNFYESKKIYDAFENNRHRDPKSFAYNYGKVLIDLFRIKRMSKDYVESESLTIKAIELFKLSENKRYVSFCYTNLGIIAKYLGRYDQAVAYHNKAIEADLGTNREIEQTLISLNNIGTTYKSQKKYSKAKETYVKALEYKEFLKKDPRRYALLTDNLAYVDFLSNNLAEIPDLFYEALKVRDSIGDRDGLTTSYFHLAEYFESTGNDSISRIYGYLTENLAKELNHNEELLKSYQILSKVSSPKEGLQYAEAYIQLNDSLVKEERLFRDKIARIQFETEEKEQQIVEKEAQIVEKEAQIATVENQNTIYLLGMLLLVMGITFAIYFFRQRTKYLAQQNQMVQFQASYETETRISKRLHDELGNDIFQVMLQYQNDPHDSQILEKLNTTYARARDISRENNEFDIDESFPEELSDMLKNYTKNGIQLLVRGLDKVDWQGFEAPVKITVYRVLQELMTNMQKHSQASMVVLVFNQDNNTLHIKYSDNGVGIDKTQLQSKNGLHNTEKRIRAIDGTLIFESEKEKGFKADIKIPA
ncbi:tetratricopeptide repeat-containing sensor histidine kinase [Aquimarina spongiae]|uniref:histidine kinase n=1 Tax=Aquimarina spongiae TaxID=570521 RepID=A0A1M6JL02_9FLAO|nr:tetratricopeptide repeat-containing sensor histidine kinase [Aquimarina spongiae]SHJ47369.1 Tetratricopeptide repeat-containing protein [Aquimarina spongiae]